MKKKSAQSKITQTDVISFQSRGFSFTDELTGLINQHGLVKQLSLELARCQRFKEPLSLLMLHIDDVKYVKNSFGDKHSDKLIQVVSNCLKDSSRNIDLPARSGYEEFMVILPGTNAANSQIYAERIKTKISLKTKPIHPEKKPVIVNIGIASIGIKGKMPTSQELISLADTALTSAKQTGKSKVLLAKT